MNDRQTDALTRRSGDARTHSRRAPVKVPQSTDQALARAEKYYCPECGVVIRVSNPLFEHRTTEKNTVLPHTFSTGLRELEMCPGGPYDPEKDAA